MINCIPTYTYAQIAGSSSFSYEIPKMRRLDNVDSLGRSQLDAIDNKAKNNVYEITINYSLPETLFNNQKQLPQKRLTKTQLITIINDPTFAITINSIEGLDNFINIL